MIIIEGMDNSGKTRLAEHIAEKFSMPLLKRPKDKSELVEEAFILLSLNPDAVLDRCSIISEMIYGPILRGGTVFDLGGPHRWIFYMDKLIRCKPLIFYCRPPDEKIFDFDNRKQMDGVVEKGQSILNAYDTFMKTWSGRLPIMKYDFTLPDVRSFADYAVEVYRLKRRIDVYEY